MQSKPVISGDLATNVFELLKYPMLFAGLWVAQLLGNKIYHRDRFPSRPSVTCPTERDLPPAIGTPCPVDENGDIQLPLVGRVHIEGLSLSEARHTLIKGYTEDRTFSAARTSAF